MPTTSPLRIEPSSELCELLLLALDECAALASYLVTQSVTGPIPGTSISEQDALGSATARPDYLHRNAMHAVKPV
jgi:hypothetical protein